MWKTRLRKLIRLLRRQGPRRFARTESLPLNPAEDRPLGCGWFDSSHDLQQGLRVQEADSQSLAAMPLQDWLALQAPPLQCELLSGT